MIIKYKNGNCYKPVPKEDSSRLSKIPVYYLQDYFNLQN